MTLNDLERPSTPLSHYVTLFVAFSEPAIQKRMKIDPSKLALLYVEISAIHLLTAIHLFNLILYCVVCCNCVYVKEDKQP